jgi:hypothetical protein
MLASHVSSRALAAAAGILAVAGCGGSGMYPVTGVVKLAGGAPAAVLQGRDVILTSVDRPSASRAEIGPDGRFTAYTNQPGDGMLPGKYKVTVYWESDTGNEGPAQQRKQPPFDAQALEAEATQILIVVEPRSNELEIVLPPPRKAR